MPVCLSRRPAARLIARLLMLAPLAASAQGLPFATAFPEAAPPPARSVGPAAPARAASPVAAVLAAPPAAAQPLPMPADPATAARPVVFGAQLFSGRFGHEAFSGFNADHQIAPGDRISLRMWGAFSFEAVQPVDPQGNVFIPNVGPVKLRGVRNGELNATVEAAVKRTYRANVGVYASLEAAQPVKVYVTGFVRAPGLYGGLSSDSVLNYLDKAGGIDVDRGSFLAVDVLRGGVSRGKINLYRFLLEGRIEPLQLQDGDTLVVSPRQFTVTVLGEAANPYVFEFDRSRLPAAELLAMARPKAGATHLSIVRRIGSERRSEYHPIGALDAVTIQDGDEVTFTADRYPGTILVRMEGAHLGERTLVLPYGATLKDALARLKPAPQAQVEAVQLFRRSVATRQKELLESSLRSLETAALTARSATSEESALRTREADLILQFIERARTVQTRGQVILAGRDSAASTLLEDNDVIRVPERSNTVLVNGEVLFPSALVFDARATLADYVARAGGYSQGADTTRVVVIRQDGSVAEAAARAMPRLLPGDELMVLPKIESKRIEVTRGITQILYQIAISARVLLGL